MVRLILWGLLLFFLPLLVAWGWLLLFRRAEMWGVNQRMLFACLGLGLLLVFAGLFVLRNSTGAPAGQDYVPPQTQDGVLVPGHFEEKR